MRKVDLIGTWKGSESDSCIHLREDGSAVCDVALRDGSSTFEMATWQYVDATHWKLKLVIPPQPDIRGLEDGAIDVSDYEVVSFTPDRMELMVFDYENPFVYEREHDRTG